MKKLKTTLKYSLCILLLIGFIVKLKWPRQSKYDKSETTVYGTITLCENKNIIISGKEKLLIKYSDNYKCKLGEKIEANGKLIKPENNRVFYLFNYKKYLLSKKIYYIFKAKSINKINTKIKLKYKIKNKIISHINKYKSKAYLKAFILGDKNEIDINTKEGIKQNGISHLIAISGMHIITILYMINIFLNKIIKNSKINQIIKTNILIFYLFITNYPASLLRGAITHIVTNTAKIANIKINKINLHIFIILFLLNINPYYIYDLGFLLTFTITIYIIIFKNLFSKNNYIIKSLKISLIAFSVSMPYIINNYFEINFFSIITNIIFIPLITFIIYPLILLTFFIKPLDTILYKITKLFELLVITLKKIKFLTITLNHIKPIFFILYFILITAILIIWKRKGKNYMWLILIVLMIHNNINFINKDTTITVIDVGQGDSLLIKLKHNKERILIDTGGLTNYSLSKKLLIPYLKAEGIKKITYLIITHGDFDHMGEAINLVNNFKIEKVIFNCGPYNDLEKELIKVLNKKKIKYYSCIKELNIDKNKLYFLQTKKYDNENDNSNVIYTELDGYKFMFMGDASSTTEKEILNKYNLPDIDVLKVGHHGSKTSSSKEFINEINPKYSAISAGKNNRYRHPNKEVLENLNNSKIYRTDHDGSIMFKIKNNKLKIETCSP